MAYIATTPRPPYYAVIFSSVSAPVDQGEHREMFVKMLERVQTFDGYLGIEGGRNKDGSGLAAVYFRDLESIERWAKDPEHQVAKKKGRELWYSAYYIRICKVEKAYGRAG